MYGLNQANIDGLENDKEGEKDEDDEEDSDDEDIALDEDVKEDQEAECDDRDWEEIEKLYSKL